MQPDSRLAEKLNGKDFIITAECLPPAGTDASFIEGCTKSFGKRITGVNVADNHYGVATSSLAVSAAIERAGIEPVYQLVTRDRNRIALQSDLLGAAFLGIKNVLCLSGFHQTLIGCAQSANVYDIDSIQLISLVKKMNEGTLLDGTKIRGKFSMLIGAAANPYMKPLELNIMRLSKKAAAGANFIQTQAVFDVELFKQWFEEVQKEGTAKNTAVLAGVLPLQSAAQGQKLLETHTDFNIPADVLNRIKAAGDAESQKKEGLKIAVEIIKKLKAVPGLRGVHILAGGNEAIVPDLLMAIST